MIRSFIQKQIHHAHKKYVLDHNIPIRFLLYVSFNRMTKYLRGYVRLKQRILLGKNIVFQGGKGKALFGTHCHIDDYSVINTHVANEFSLGRYSKIGAYSRIIGTSHLSKIGKHFHLGGYSACSEFCYFGCAGGITIGQRTIIGQYVSFHAQEHLFNDTDNSITSQGTTEEGIYIGDDCWIGAKATILDGTIIGNHCVIAAGSVVKGTFPNNVLIAGVPAKIVRHLNTDHSQNAQAVA